MIPQWHICSFVLQPSANIFPGLSNSLLNIFLATYLLCQAQRALCLTNRLAIDGITAFGRGLDTLLFFEIHHVFSKSNGARTFCLLHSRFDLHGNNGTYCLTCNMVLESRFEGFGVLWVKGQQPPKFVVDNNAERHGAEDAPVPQIDFMILGNGPLLWKINLYIVFGHHFDVLFVVIMDVT
jgi:hypothetical protein